MDHRVYGELEWLVRGKIEADTHARNKLIKSAERFCEQVNINVGLERKVAHLVSQRFEGNSYRFALDFNFSTGKGTVSLGIPFNMTLQGEDLVLTSEETGQGQVIDGPSWFLKEGFIRTPSLVEEPLRAAVGELQNASLGSFSAP